MSIVICVIDNNKELYLASDLRREMDGVFTDDCNKIFEIRDSLYIGFTGALEPGLTFLKYIKEIYGNASVSKLMQIVDREFPNAVIISSYKEGCTATLAGRDDNYNLFIFTKESNGASKLFVGSPETISFSVTSDSNEVTEKLKSKIEEIDKITGQQGRFLKAIKDTIAFASEKDDFISKESCIKIIMRTP